MRLHGAAIAVAVSLAAACALLACTPQPSKRVSVPDTTAAPVKALPGGGRVIFPAYRVVALYGTADDPTMGDLGAGSPDQAGQRLLRQAAAYITPRRRVLPAFELIATVAQASAGDGDYNARLSDTQIRSYLTAARKIGALLILDVQPGRAAFLPEVRRYETLLAEPDVGLALDSEWKMGPGEIPGRTIGGTDAAGVNAVSAYLANLVARERLPQKLLVLHEFTPAMIAHREQVVPRRGLAIVFHIDGFGGRAVKLAAYRRLAVRSGPFFNGFKLFSHQDVRMFAAGEVLGIRPPPDLVTYQ